MDAIKILEAVSEISDTKNISENQIINAFKKSLEQTYKSKVNSAAEVVAIFDKQTGQVGLDRIWRVVSEIDNSEQELTPEQAKIKYHQQANPGDVIKTPVKFNDKFNRLAVMVFAQHFKSIIREIEQVSVYEAYADTSGELLFGRVEKKLENYLLIRVNKQRETFAIIKDYELLPKDNYKKGDRIFFLTKNVLARSNTAQIQGTRTSSEFLKKILAYEIPEVDNKIIEVVSVARNPGVRSKVVVRSNDKAVDPVGACIGVNGNRINSISQELRGEQIDIFKDSDDKQELALRAFQPAKVISIVTTERQVEVHKYQTKPDASKPPETKTITHAYVVLLEEQFSLVLGKRGRNLKMIGNLLGWQIHLVSYQQAMRSETNFPWNGNIRPSEINDLLIKIQKRFVFRQKPLTMSDQSLNKIKQLKEIISKQQKSS